MKFPWKSAKVIQFSRLLSKIETLPRRRESLVVETGFPTSLIDLFVKHRDHVKKSSKKSNKKKKHGIISADNNVSNPEILRLPEPEPVISEIEVIPMSGLERNHSERDFRETEFRKSGIRDLGDASLLGRRDKITENDRILVRKSMLLIVVLGFVKKLVLGITMSGLVLLFMEYIWNDMFLYSRQCLVKLESLIRRVSILIRRKRHLIVVSEIEEEEIWVPDQIKSKGKEEIHSAVPYTQSELNSKDVIEKGEDSFEVSHLERQGKFNGGLKSKIIKGIASLKNNSWRKKKGGGIDWCEKGDAEQENVYDLISSPPLEEEEEEEEDTSKNLQAGVGIITADEEKVERLLLTRNSGHLILILVVLLGLFGGRILAFVATIGWCVLLESANKLGSFSHIQTSI